MIFSINRVCCRSPIVPVRPTYSAELLSSSFNGSLPRSSGAVGSAPDLSGVERNVSSNGGGTLAASEPRTTSSSGNDSRSSPVTNVWTNPYHDPYSHLAHHQHNHHYANDSGTRMSMAVSVCGIWSWNRSLEQNWNTLGT